MLVRRVSSVLVLLIVLALAWKWEWIGCVAYSTLGVLYIWNFAGRFPLLTYVLIAGPLFVVGALFAIDWILRKELHEVVGTRGERAILG